MFLKVPSVFNYKILLAFGISESLMVSYAKQHWFKSPDGRMQGSFMCYGILSNLLSS